MHKDVEAESFERRTAIDADIDHFIIVRASLMVVMHHFEGWNIVSSLPSRRFGRLASGSLSMDMALLQTTRCGELS